MTLLDGDCAVPPTLTLSGPAPAVPGLDLRPAAEGWIRAAFDPAISDDEGYRLEIRPEGVRLAARLSAGLRWGLTTLGQVLAQCPRRVPCLQIDDAPAFRHRGWMLDVSRDRVPTMASLEALVDAAAACKINNLQLYTEHTFAYAGHEAVWRAADPLTPAEVRALDAYATGRGVALCANQNCLGHFERWLRVPAYAGLGEIDRPWYYESWQCFFEPNTLRAGDPAVLALLRGLLGQLAPCCSGGLVNVNCDEPMDLAHARGPAARPAFTAHLQAVAAMVRDLGRRPMFWCDPEPNEGEGLESDLIALVWGYESDADFATRLKPHRQQGREVWVAPGTSSWATLVSRTWNRRGNLAAAARQGLAHEATGFLTTEWGDCGHKYPTGKRITDEEYRELRIMHEDFHGEWNYSVLPRRP